MRGLILVLDTPYFVVTDATGRYRLDGLPAGHYVLKAWLDSKTTLEQPVELAARRGAARGFPVTRRREPIESGFVRASGRSCWWR